MKILIVEDHADTAQVVAKILAMKLQAEVSVARTLSEGLALSNQMVADITILDLCLPGTEVNAVIESIPLFKPPVVVVTDLDDEEGLIEIECYKHRAQNFFSKEWLRQQIVENSGAALVAAITRTHWRHSLPTAEVRAMQPSGDMPAAATD